VGVLSKVINEIQMPKSRLAVFEPTRDQCLDVFIEPFLDMIPSRWITSYNKTHLKFKFINGSQLKLHSGEAFKRLRGVDANHVFVDEFQDQDFQMVERVILPTLGVVKGKLDVTGTPSPTAHEWRDFMQSQAVSLHTWTTAQGGLIEQSELDYFKSIMDDRAYRQEFEAEWLEIGGQIAYNFSKESIVDVAFDTSLTTWVSYDFNVNPMTAVVIQEKDGIGYVIQDFQIANSNTEHTTAIVCEYLAKQGLTSGKIFVTGDYAGKSRSTKGGGVTDYQLIETVMNQMGYTVNLDWIRRTKRIEDRHLLTNVALKRANGTRTMFINKNCKYLIKSLERVTREDFSKGDPKGLTHIYDAFTYWCYNNTVLDKTIW
jgi:hypothetical protein